MKEIICRNGTIADIPAVAQIQQRYHTLTIREEDRADGFVTTLFSPAQFQAIIKQENGLALALDGERVVAYAMAASWEFWSEWALFQYMIADLPQTTYRGVQLTTVNSYQYGPVCIDKAYRGQGVLPKIFDFSLHQMAKRYPIMITFINQNNPRSFKAHTQKVHLDVIKTFNWNNNHYYELGCMTK